MTEDKVFDRITTDPEIFGGKADYPRHENGCGTRAGDARRRRNARETPSRVSVLRLEPADIQACLAYAHRSLAG